MELAWWFNVGVQIFLCVSGFLYGQKEIGDIVDFYKKRIKKILVPYYLVLLSATLLQIVFARNIFSTARLIAAMVCRTTIRGGGNIYGLLQSFSCVML